MLYAMLKYKKPANVFHNQLRDNRDQGGAREQRRQGGPGEPRDEQAARRAHELPAPRDGEQLAPRHGNERRLEARQVDERAPETEQPALQHTDEPPASALARMDRSRDEPAAPPLCVEQPAHARTPAEAVVSSICAREPSSAQPACDGSPAPPLGVEQLAPHAGGKPMRLASPTVSVRALCCVFASWRDMAQRRAATVSSDGTFLLSCRGPAMPRPPYEARKDSAHS